MSLDDMLLQRETGRPLGDGWGQSPSGLFIPEAEQAHTLPIAVDLFCGAGGFSTGLHMAGFHVIGATDYDAISAITYLTNLGSRGVKIHFLEEEDEERFTRELRKTWGLKNPRNGRAPRELTDEDIERLGDRLADPEQRVSFVGTGWIGSYCDHEWMDCAPHLDEGDLEKRRWFHETYCADPPHREGCEHFWLGDVRELTGERICSDLGVTRGEIDLVVGGPPCQGFSIGGKRQVMDPRNSLVFDFMRVVTELHPKAFMMENVPGMLSMVTEDGLPVVDALCRIAEDGGFSNYDAIKRALANTGGMGALAGKPNPAGKRPKKRKKGPTKKKPSPQGQQSLLDEAAS